MAEAQRAYDAGEWNQAADIFAELLTEPEALSGANEMHWNMAMCFARLANFDLALEHVRAGGYDVDEFRRNCEQHGVTVPSTV
jgi:hypothetical protein